VLWLADCLQLTSTEDLWSIDQQGGVNSGSFSFGSGEEVTDEDVQAYLLSHANQQQHEAHGYQQELTRRRAKVRGSRGKKGPRKLLGTRSVSHDSADFAEKIMRVVPDIGEDARVELSSWEGKIDSWDFDIFRVNELTNGTPLAFVLFAVFSRYRLMEKLNLEERTVISLAHALDAGYTAQAVAPYHNNIHGADVIQALSYVIRNAGLNDRLVDTEILAAVLAAAVHDIAHPAVTNNFHAETFSPMAMLYNDQSVNENHHLASGFAILQKPENDLTRGLSRADRKGVRSMMIRLVLATDLANHFDYIARLNTKLDSAEAAPLTSPRSSKPPPIASPGSKVVPLVSGSPQVPLDPADSPTPVPDTSPAATLEPLLLMETAMKMADVANGARMPSVFNGWGQRVFEEFYLQGDMEAEAKLPISAFMDRRNPNEAKCQSSFLQYIVGPLYAVGKRIWPEMNGPTAQLEANKKALEERAAAAAAEAAAGDSGGEKP